MFLDSPGVGLLLVLFTKKMSQIFFISQTVANLGFGEFYWVEHFLCERIPPFSANSQLDFSKPAEHNVPWDIFFAHWEALLRANNHRKSVT